jgi:hypothetical protein
MVTDTLKSAQDSFNQGLEVIKNEVKKEMITMDSIISSYDSLINKADDGTW